MTATTLPAARRPAVRRIVLVPETRFGRSDELVRRYRLARLTAAEHAGGAPGSAPGSARSGL